jgi:2-(1,2-epoxy-1,2-dihydrophenyl)acetyl-CoA isomerase
LDAVPSQDVLITEDVGRLRVLRLNRPERKNALDGRLIRALTVEMRRAAHDDDVWAVALTGNGDSFCSGLDLAPGSDTSGEAAKEPDSATGYEAADNMAMLMRVECEKPVLAGVNGATVGMGVALALAADIRIASPAARFHPGYARVGTSPDGGATWTVTEAVGYERSMRFFLESRWIEAPEALAIGLVGDVTETAGDFDARFLRYGEQLAAVAPIAARQTKRLVGQASRPTDVAAHLDEEVRLALVGLSSEDSAQAIAAMFTHEKPEFRGR